MLLSLNAVSKTYADHHVLDDVSLILNRGDRTGLVGANGVGKSTVVKIIVGDVEADSGTVTLAKGVEPGYVPQTVEHDRHQTISDLLHASQRQLRLAEQRMHELTASMATAQGAELEAALSEYGTLAEWFEQRGGYDLAYKIGYVLDGLRVSYLDPERPLATLSGGEKTRVALAALLIGAPDVLLLDEPTNHLDFATAAWLETYLQNHHGAMLVVSHDRRFLNTVATSIIELDEHTHRAKAYAGNYDAYLLQKTKERQRWEAEYAAQQDEIKQLRRTIKSDGGVTTWHGGGKAGNDKFAKGFFKGRSEATISRAIRNAEEKLARIEADPIPQPPKPLRFRPSFDSTALDANIALTVSDVSMTFGDQTLLGHVGFTLGTNSRMLIVGPNGAGKTTLLNLIAGKLKPQHGIINVAPSITLGYLEQEEARHNADQTVFDAYREGLIGFEQAHMSDLLAYGLFTYEETTKQVHDLSVGQRRKLQLARLMASQANLLLLDEPTNHLSFDVLEQFEQALREFVGPIIAVSHDRWFIERFNGEVWQLQDGRLEQMYEWAI
jgi:macrolide transport system ATP-binding/permease protein